MFSVLVLTSKGRLIMGSPRSVWYIKCLLCIDVYKEFCNCECVFECLL